MEYVILVLFSMIFLHIIDDFVLQSAWLSNGKQKSWWEENAPDDKYKNDYLMALFMHSFSWSFMVMLAPTIYCIWAGCFDVIAYVILLAWNVWMHFRIDDDKANHKTINLVIDQLLHLLQIVATWLLVMLPSIMALTN